MNLFSTIIYKTDPVVVYEQDSTTQPKRYDLNSQQFAIVFTLLDENLNPFFDETLYTMQGQIYHKNKVWDQSSNTYKEDINSQDIELGRCIDQDFQEPGTRSYFLGLDYTKMYCIKNTSQLFIEGQYDADRFTMVRININECSKSQSVICQEQTRRQELLANTRLQVYYVNRIIQIRNYNSPFSTVGQTQFWRTNYDMVQQLNLMFVNTYVADDISLFYGENYQNQNNLVFSQGTLLFGSRDPIQEDNLYQIEIYMDKNKENIYRRTYLKFPQAISQIGGIFNVFFALGCLFSHPYARMQLQRKLINQTFTLDEGEFGSGHKNPSKKPKNNKNISLGKMNKSGSPRKDNLPIPQQNFTSLFKSDLHCIPKAPSEAGFQQKLKDQGCINQNVIGQTQIQNSQNTFRNMGIQQDDNEQIGASSIRNTIRKNDQKQENTTRKDQETDSKRKVTDCKIKMSASDSSKTKRSHDHNIFFEIFEQFKVGTVDYMKSYLQYFTKSKNDKVDLLQYCIKKIQNYTDICFFVNKLMEVEKLKKLMLDEDQMILFDCIQKPKINYSLIEQETEDIETLKIIEKYNQRMKEQTPCDTRNVEGLTQQNEGLNDRLKRAKGAFKRIQSKNRQNDDYYNSKLLQMLDADLLDYLQKENQTNNNNNKNKDSLEQKQDQYVQCLQFGMNYRDLQLNEITQMHVQSESLYNISIPGLQHDDQTNLQQQEESSINFKEESIAIQKVLNLDNVNMFPVSNNQNEVNTLNRSTTITKDQHVNDNQISFCEQEENN